MEGLKMSSETREPTPEHEAPSEIHEVQGELFVQTWEWRWVEAGAYLEAGTVMVPIRITPSDQTTEYAALHLADDDLALAGASFEEAAKSGTPNDANLLAKALIHAGVTAYARSFATGVRGFKLTPGFFGDWDADALELHKYLYDLRDKHVAHSVNDMERAETVGHVTTDRDFRLLATNPTGVGVIKLTMIGLPMSKLRRCGPHITAMRARIKSRILELDPEIHAQMISQVTVGQRVTLAPLVTFPDRSKVGERR